MVKNALLYLCLLISLGFTCGTTAAADLPDFKVNDDHGSSQQDNPRIAVAIDGSFTVTWVDRRNGETDIYLQRFDPWGYPVGGNIMVNDDSAASAQFNPTIAVDLFGRYALAWTDYREGTYPFDPGIFFQPFDSMLTATGANSNLTAAAGGAFKETPDISVSTWGAMIIVWGDYRNSNWDIYGQIVRSDGSLVGENFLVNDDLNLSQQHAPRVSTSPEGWFVVTWYDNRGGDDDVFAQRFDSLGNKLGLNTQVNTNVDGSRQAFPDVATDGAGRFTVVWVDWRNGEYPLNPDIYSCRFDTSMTALAENKKISTESNQMAQRQPAIASDRMGNVAIIWADSTFTSWDITGQMLDVDGKLRESNFRANSFGDSTQLRPDVALDGRYRYITWADNRNGNFDVYASITKYNQPAIVVSPPSVSIEMPVGGPVPAPVTLAVNHGGYNRLNYQILGMPYWLSVTPSNGQTPDTVALAITADTLSLGTYLAALTFVDLNNNDSSTVASVRLDVTGPELSLSVGTLDFRTFLGLPQTELQTVDISNVGSGNLSWNATASDSWISLSSQSGTAPSAIDISILSASLDTGLYSGTVVIDAGAVTNSPDTIVITVEVFPDLAQILPSPDSLYLTVVNSLVDTFLVVNNSGTSGLNWTASVDQLWLSLATGAGTDGDTIHFSIVDSFLTPGLQSGSIGITDAAAYIPTVAVPIVVDFVEEAEIVLSLDSIYIQSTESVNLDTFVVVRNNGPGQLNWQAASDQNWASISPLSGVQDDTVRIKITDSLLSQGVHIASIDFVDSATINKSVTLPIVLEKLPPIIDSSLIADTAIVESVNVQSGQAGSFAVRLKLNNPATAVTLPLSHDATQVQVDSVLFDPAIPRFINRAVAVDSASGLLFLRLWSDSVGAGLPASAFDMAVVHFTASGLLQTTSIAAYSDDTLKAGLITINGDSLGLVVVRGSILNSSPTGVGDSDKPLPTSFTLHQNYPNPFNPTTTIEFDIPFASQVELEVFNILGQKVVTLVSERLSAGNYRAGWDGRFRSGRNGPSGIYFYRLRAENVSLVRKMVLIK